MNEIIEAIQRSLTATEALFVVFMLTRCADVWTTHRGLATGQFYEANKFVAAYMRITGKFWGSVNLLVSFAFGWWCVQIGGALPLMMLTVVSAFVAARNYIIVSKADD